MDSTPDEIISSLQSFPNLERFTISPPEANNRDSLFKMTDRSLSEIVTKFAAELPALKVFSLDGCCYARQESEGHCDSFAAVSVP
jgi:hypothetical protein